MVRALGIALAGLLIVAAAGPARAVPPGPGQHFDCSDGGDTSCPVDDTGCVSNTTSHLKCSSTLDKALARAVYMVAICHEKQAKARRKGVSDVDAGATEEECETYARATLERTMTNLQSSGRCDPVQLSNAAAVVSKLFDPGPESLDARNALYYCDSTSGTPLGDDDAGWVPDSAAHLKCAGSVARNVGKLRQAQWKCHDKMDAFFFKGKDFNETACEENDPVRHRAAIDKYVAVRDKLLASGICPPCLDFAAQSQLGSDTLDEGDETLDQLYPCNLGP